MEYITQAVDFINENSGMVAFCAIIVSIYIYKRQRYHDKKAMRNELDAMDEHDIFFKSDCERNRDIRRRTLEKNLKN